MNIDLSRRGLLASGVGTVLVTLPAFSAEAETPAGKTGRVRASTPTPQLEEPGFIAAPEFELWPT